MRFRNIATIALLLIVGATLLKLAIGRERSISPAVPGTEQEVAAQRDGVYVFYFHRTQRCVTCRSIEDTARESLRGQLADALAEDRLRWEALNLDEAENTHFVDDFELVASSLVLAEYRDGALVRFEDLDKIWELIGDVPQFSEYVVTRSRNFLAQG